MRENISHTSPSGWDRQRGSNHWSTLKPHSPSASSPPSQPAQPTVTSNNDSAIEALTATLIPAQTNGNPPHHLHRPISIPSSAPSSPCTPRSAPRWRPGASGFHSSPGVHGRRRSLTRNPRSRCRSRRWRRTGCPSGGGSGGCGGSASGVASRWSPRRRPSQTGTGCAAAATTTSAAGPRCRGPASACRRWEGSCTESWALGW